MHPEQVVGYAFHHVYLFVFRGRKEIGTLERINGDMDFLAKKSGDLPRRTFPDQHAHNLMSLVSQFLAKRKRLRQMSAPLSLYDKQYSHITSA